MHAYNVPQAFPHHALPACVTFPKPALSGNCTSTTRIIGSCEGVSRCSWFGFARSALLLAVDACIVLSLDAMPCLSCYLPVALVRPDVPISCCFSWRFICLKSLFLLYFPTHTHLLHHSGQERIYDSTGNILPMTVTGLKGWTTPLVRNYNYD